MASKKEDLVKGGCATAHEADTLFIHSRCHPESRMLAEYNSVLHLLTIICRKCEKQIATFDVVNPDLRMNRE